MSIHRLDPEAITTLSRRNSSPRRFLARFQVTGSMFLTFAMGQGFVTLPSIMNSVGEMSGVIARMSHASSAWFNSTGQWNVVDGYAGMQWYETTCVATPPALTVTYLTERRRKANWTERRRLPLAAAACTVWWRPLSPAMRTATATTTPTPTLLAATMARRGSRRSALISSTPYDLGSMSFHLASTPPTRHPSLDRPVELSPHYSIDPTGEALCVPFASFERRLRIALVSPGPSWRRLKRVARRREDSL